MPIGKYEEIGAETGRLVDKKQKAYGRSFDHVGDVLKLMYPDGIKLEQYHDLTANVRVLDKLFRVATSKDAFGESLWQDIAGYGLLMCRHLLPPQTTQLNPDDVALHVPWSDGLPGCDPRTPREVNHTRGQQPSP